MHGTIVCLAVALLAALPRVARGEHLDHEAQSWWSINSTTRLTDRWGVVGDFHIRRNDFAQDPVFYFLRAGAHYWLTEKLAATAGYGHMWQAPAQDDWDTWTNEERVYEQLQYGSKIGKVGVLHRLRNEQRWSQQAVDDALTGHWAFSDRLRYLVSFSIPVSTNPAVPSLVLSHEVLVQFGPGAASTFDQDRLFIGIKQSLTPSWSFDFGYMPVYKRKTDGDQDVLNHTLRLFVYFTPDLRAAGSVHEPASNDE